MRRVTAKLANQRKARDWLVSPCDDGELIVQADGAIGKFDFRTRTGVLNTRGGYFMHLSPVMGAKAYEFPADFVRDCLEACPALDGQTSLAGGAVIVENTVRTLRTNDTSE
jgi:hypothetical protein